MQKNTSGKNAEADQLAGISELVLIVHARIDKTMATVDRKATTKITAHPSQASGTGLCCCPKTPRTAFTSTTTIEINLKLPLKPKNQQSTHLEAAS